MTEQQTTDSPSARPNRVPIWVKVLGIVVIVLAAAWVAGNVMNSLAVGQASAAPAGGTVGSMTGPYTVTIEGDGTASVATNEDGSTQQQTKVDLPYSFQVTPGTSSVAVVAQLMDEFGTTLSCRIADSGTRVVKEAHSSGQYTTVSCASALP